MDGNCRTPGLFAIGVDVGPFWPLENRASLDPIDDAAGEALDKGAELIGLGNPGGPKLERVGSTGNPRAFDFPRALMNKANLDLSFSGLKTSLRYTLDRFENAEIQEQMPDLCASYQCAVVDALIRKADRA